MNIEDIQEVIDDFINPGLEQHGGFIKIEKFDKKTNDLEVSMGGGCKGCSKSQVTLRLQIENFLKMEFPDLGNIIDLTNHEEGGNPYYKSDEE